MRGGTLLMAILVALLLGAPSVVFAAPPNRLEAAAAEPTTGTPLTTFHFAVRYVSSMDSPAGGVTAQIGPLEVPLHLASGTVTDGIWSGSALLPVGTWSLTYQATADEGPIASLAGPTLTVVDEASPIPEARPGSEESAPISGGGADVDQPSSGPAESPEAEPKAPGRPTTPDMRTPEPAPADGGRSGGDGGSVAGDTPQPAPRGDDRASGNGRRRGGAAPLRHSPETPAPEALTTPVDDPATSKRGELLLLLGAIVTVATVALLGTGWLLASREREDERAGDSAGANGATVARAARRRRARATAGVRPAYDPVLAALGLDEADGADGADGEAQDPQRGAARGAAPRPRKAPRGPR